MYMHACVRVRCTDACVCTCQSCGHVALVRSATHGVLVAAAAAAVAAADDDDAAVAAAVATTVAAVVAAAGCRCLLEAQALLITFAVPIAPAARGAPPERLEV